MKTCRNNACTRPATASWGFCLRHYRYELAVGRHGTVDTTETRNHILALRNLGWTYSAMAAAAGIHVRTAKAIAGGQRRVSREIRDAILPLPLNPYPATHLSVDSTGTRRRIEALLWLGWPMREVEQRTGIKVNSLRCARSQRAAVSYWMAHKLAEAYEELAFTLGPSKQVATRARNAGYAPPLAWDDDTIDDPAAEPDLGGGPERFDEVAIEAVLKGRASSSILSPVDVVELENRLIADGVSQNKTANVLGISKSSYSSRIKRRRVA